MDVLLMEALLFYFPFSFNFFFFLLFHHDDADTPTGTPLWVLFRFTGQQGFHFLSGIKVGWWHCCYQHWLCKQPFAWGKSLQAVWTKALHSVAQLVFLATSEPWCRAHLRVELNIALKISGIVHCMLHVWVVTYYRTSPLLKGSEEIHCSSVH